MSNGSDERILRQVAVTTRPEYVSTKVGKIKQDQWGGYNLTFYLDRRSARFFVDLPDGRQVSAASMADLEAAMPTVMRTLVTLDWIPIIYAERLTDTFRRSGHAPPADAFRYLEGGSPYPEWLTPSAGLDARREWIASRKRGITEVAHRWGDLEWLTLPWETDPINAAEDPMWLIGRATPYRGPAPGEITGTAATIPYTEERWATIGALVDNLRRMNLQVSALFAEAAPGQTHLALRLDTGKLLTG